MTLFNKYTISFYDLGNTAVFNTSFISNSGTKSARLIIAAASSLHNPVNKLTIIRSDAMLSFESQYQHFFKKSVIKMFEDIVDEYHALMFKLPYGLYEYRGIRIVNSNQAYHKCTDEDVVDMDSIDPADMIKVKYAAALVHAFIILQTEEKLPDWLEEELEVHKAVNILEG